MNFFITITGVIGAILLVDAERVAAQSVADSGRVQVGNHGQSPLCWRGRPQARCRAFLLFEMSGPRHVAGTKLDATVTQAPRGHIRWDQGLASQFLYDLGGMVNVRPRDAIGGSLSLGLIVDDPGTAPVIGANFRYRRWITRIVSADAAAGIYRMPVGTTVLRANGLERVSVMRPALSADVRLGLGDLLAINGRGMVATDGRGRTHHALFAGISTGSTLTATVTGVYAAVLLGYRMFLGGRGYGD